MNREHIEKVRSRRKGKEYFTLQDVTLLLNKMIWEASHHARRRGDCRMIPKDILKDMERLSDDICYRVSAMNNIYRSGKPDCYVSDDWFSDSEEEESGEEKPERRKAKQHIEEEEETSNE